MCRCCWTASGKRLNGGPGKERQDDRAAAAEQIDPGVVQLGQVEGEPDQAERQDRSHRSRGNHAAHHLGRSLLLDPLQGERPLQGVEVVKPDGHDDGGYIQPDHAGKEPGRGGAQAEGQQRQIGEGLLPYDQQDEDHGEGQEARDLSQALQYPHLGSGEGRPFDGEIVEQRLPGGEAQRGRRREQ